MVKNAKANPEKLVAHIRERIKHGCETIEQKRTDLECNAVSCFAHGGRWDIAPDDFSRRIEKNVLSLAKSERDANVLIDAILAKTQISMGDCGGDHHAGYFQDYDVSTSAAIAFSENIPELQELLRLQEQSAKSPDNLTSLTGTSELRR